MHLYFYVPFQIWNYRKKISPQKKFQFLRICVKSDQVIGDHDLIADHFFSELSDLIGNWSPIPFWPHDRELIADRKKSDRSLLWKFPKLSRNAKKFFVVYFKKYQYQSHFWKDFEQTWFISRFDSVFGWFGRFKGRFWRMNPGSGSGSKEPRKKKVWLKIMWKFRFCWLILSQCEISKFTKAFKNPNYATIVGIWHKIGETEGNTLKVKLERIQS